MQSIKIKTIYKTFNIISGNSNFKENIDIFQVSSFEVLLFLYYLQNRYNLESHNWIKTCILIGLRSEVFSVELRVENEAKWYCFAST